MTKRWQLQAGAPTAEAQLTKELHISPVLSKMLVNRGITTVEEGRHFLRDTIADSADPYRMKGLEAAVLRLDKAIEEQERIVIYGDYDVDGITATAIMCAVLRDLGAAPKFYIPERQSEGYGLHQEALEYLQQIGTQVLVTVDCGIASHDLVARFNTAMDIIITDHHEPPPKVPPAYAVLDAKQVDCSYPYKELAGAGVAHLLCRALWQKRRHTPLENYAEIVALGTIADLVPLTGENRALVRAGLQRMRQGANMGLQALFQEARIEAEKITAGRIAYTIAPRLNAAGRISHAKQGVQLLLSHDREETRTIAARLTALNQERQRLEQDIAQLAATQISAQGREKDGVLIAYGEDWHPGVIGIAASRLVEKFYRPALVISIQNGIGKGSCRSIPGFNMYQALQFAEDLLLQYGGHTMAAGFSVRVENIEALRRRLCEYAAQQLCPDDYIPRLAIDMQLDIQDISLELIQELSCLEPYGMGNSRPIFSLSRAVLQHIQPIGAGNRHLRLVIDTPQRELTAIGWSMSEAARSLLAGDQVGLAFQLERNEFRGQVMPQLVVQDIHAPEVSVHLNRATMVDVYTAVRVILQRCKISVYAVQQRLLRKLENQYDGHVLYAALQVLTEIGVLRTENTAGGLVYYLPVMKEKMQLENSPTYCKYTSA